MDTSFWDYIGAEEGEQPTTWPLHAVEDLVVELAEGPLAGLRVGKMHGRMTPDDKDRTMRAFAAGEIDVLVSTTVIEVGVDVANATMMVLMDADRIGQDFDNLLVAFAAARFWHDRGRYPGTLAELVPALLGRVLRRLRPLARGLQPV